MSLGANRDYKTWDRKVRTALAEHAKLTNLYSELGIEKLAASALASIMVRTRKARKKIWRTK